MAEAIILVQWRKPIEAPHEKTCIKCGGKKDKNEFRVDHSCSDNRRNICTSCEKIRDQRNKENRKKRNAQPDPEKFFNF